MTTTSDRRTTTATAVKYRVLGTRPIRHDGLDKVTGRAKYGADVNMPGMLHAKILRSPHAHARIKAIDTSAAEALPGVRAVVTGQDLPILEEKTIDWGESQGNNRMLAENTLARDKVLYKGHAVAAVAATSQRIAEEALKLIQVDYEVLQPVFNVDDAMKEGAPLLHEDMTIRTLAARFTRGTDTGVHSNIGSHIQFKRGDLEQGFREASIVVEREFTTATVHQGYIEPHVSTAFWAPDGRLTIWTSTQGAFAIRAQTAGMLGIQDTSIKVIPMEIGGGFGGKLVAYTDPVAALLSRKSGKPVKVAMSREEVFKGSGPASAAKMRLKVGAAADGRITAAEFWLAYEAGAYPGSPVGSGANTGLAPYKIDNLQVDGLDVVVNKARVQAYRAPGSPQAAFAVETVMDEIAEKCGLDPLEFRLRNAVREGDRQPSGVQFREIGAVEVIAAMRAHPHYTAPLAGPNRGRGVALGYWGNAGNHSSCTINVHGDGRISLITGSVDIGGTRAAIAMQAAEVLGITAEDVIPSVADTDSIGWTAQTGGSRTAFSTGIAAISAAEEIKRQMVGRAALLWECTPEEVDVEDGVFTHRANPENRLTFKQLARQLNRTGGPVTASASSNPRQIGPAFGGMMVDVEVDPETGKVQVLRCTMVQDVGMAAHPSYVEGQMQGGAAQGIGWALNEEYFWSEDGTMLNASLLDYRIPTALDLPMIDTVIVEVPNPGHPFGVRGVGEVPLVPPPGAVANAIYRAIGVRLNKMPMSPGAILEALEGKQA